MMASVLPSSQPSLPPLAPTGVPMQPPAPSRAASSVLMTWLSLLLRNLKNKFYSLLKKVTDQAAELTRLSSELSDALTYISLCEERIRQLDPYATFPITEDEI